MLLLIGMTGCSSGDVEASRSGSSSAVASGTMSKAQAADYYESLAETSNAASLEYKRAYYSSDVPATTAQAEAMAAAYRDFARKLKEGDWPDDAQKYVDVLAADLEAEASDYELASQAATMDEIDAAFTTKDNGADASLRNVLGLPEPETVSPVLVTGGVDSGDDGYGRLHGTFTVQNGLTVPIRSVFVSVAFLDASGNSSSTTASQTQWIGAGQSGDVEWSLSSTEPNAVSAKATEVSWSAGDDGGNAQRVLLSGPTIEFP